MNPSGYKLGCHISLSTLYSSFILEFKAVLEEIFKGPTHIFVASFVLEIFTCLFQFSLVYMYNKDGYRGK